MTEERLVEYLKIADNAASNGVNAPDAIRELAAEVRRLRAELAAKEELIKTSYVTRLAYETIQAALASARQDAQRWQWAKPVLSGDDTPAANAKTLELAAGLMRTETVEQVIDKPAEGR